MKILPPRLSRCFTQIPNEVIDHPIWREERSTAAQLALIELYRYGNWGGTAEEYGRLTGRHSIRKFYPIWERSGFVRRNGQILELYPFADGQPLPEIEFEPVEEQKTVAEEVSTLPATKKRIPAADRWEMITSAWNNNKPECYNLFGGKNEGVKIAIGAHMKRLGLETDAYEQFISAVLRGCALDSWWSTKDGMAPKAVFGFGQQLTDDKYERVEKLYRAGVAALPKPTLNEADDEALLAASKTSSTRVSRIDTSNADLARSLFYHLYAVRYQRMPGEGISPQQVAEAESFKTAGLTPDDTWYDVDVLIVIRVNGKNAHWTSRERLPRA